MKPCLFLTASSLVFAADWDAVQRIPAAQRIEVTEPSGGGRLRASSGSVACVGPAFCRQARLERASRAQPLQHESCNRLTPEHNRLMPDLDQLIAAEVRHVPIDQLAWRFLLQGPQRLVVFDNDGKEKKLKLRIS